MKTTYKNLTVIEKPTNVEDLFPLVEKEDFEQRGWKFSYEFNN